MVDDGSRHDREEEEVVTTTRYFVSDKHHTGTAIDVDDRHYELLLEEVRLLLPDLRETTFLEYEQMRRDYELSLG